MYFFLINPGEDRKEAKIHKDAEWKQNIKRQWSCQFLLWLFPVVNCNRHVIKPKQNRKNFTSTRSQDPRHRKPEVCQWQGRLSASRPRLNHVINHTVIWRRHTCDSIRLSLLTVAIGLKIRQNNWTQAQKLPITPDNFTRFYSCQD